MTTNVRTHPVVARVLELTRPVVEREGYELVDLEYTTERGRTILRMFIDTVPPGTEERGVTVDDCSHVSRIVGSILDVEDVVSGNYALEVSSPGLFRPLTKPAHFERVLGERVKVKTYQKRDGRSVFTGTLKSYAPDALTVEIDGQAFDIAMSDIAKANLEPVL